MRPKFKYTQFLLYILTLMTHSTALAQHEHHEDEHHHSEKETSHTEAHDHGTEDSHHQGRDENSVSLPNSVLREFGIETAKAKSGTIEQTFNLPGEIQYNRETLAYATPRYSGTILKIHAKLADSVNKNDVLAVVESNETLRPFDVRAPFNGTVVAYNITLGQSVEAGRPLFTIANLSTVWADLRVYQSNLTKLHPGQEVVIKAGHDIPPFHGKIHYIAPNVDEHTRTGLARVVVDNEQGYWKPGLFITGTVKADTTDAPVVVPKEAVIKMDGQSVVFVRTDDVFKPVQVVQGTSDAHHVAITEGLDPGQEIVVKNAISLKAEMGKGSFGGHHHH